MWKSVDLYSHQALSDMEPMEGDMAVVEPDIIKTLREDHRDMRVLLKILRAEIDRCCAKEHADFDLLSQIMDYLINYPDLCHHHREDIIFAQLKRRVPALAVQSETIMREHKDLAALNRRLAAALHHMKKGVEMPRDWLDSLARSCIAGNLEHMNKEDRFYFPLAADSLSTADWQEVARDIDSMEARHAFGDSVKSDYRRLLARIKRLAG